MSQLPELTSERSKKIDELIEAISRISFYGGSEWGNGVDANQKEKARRLLHELLGDK